MPELAGYVPIGFLLIALIWAGFIALIAAVLYQVIWRAVRRGLREYHEGTRTIP